MAVNIEERKKWEIKPGNTVKVWLKIKEGDKTRLQAFEGLIIAHKHGFEQGATFIVRKISSGVGVERIFPVFSPNIEKIEITKRAKVRRSKLYYIRDKAAKQIRKKMKLIKMDDRKKKEVEIKEAEEIAKDKTVESKENIKDVKVNETEGKIEDVKPEVETEKETENGKSAEDEITTPTEGNKEETSKE